MQTRGFGRELEVVSVQEIYFGFGFGTSQKGVHDKAGKTKATNITFLAARIKKNNELIFFHVVGWRLAAMMCMVSHSSPRDFLNVDVFSSGLC